MSQKVFKYKSLCYRSFFFDKHTTENVFKCPILMGVSVHVYFSCVGVRFRTLFLKLFFLFYLNTGNKPHVIVKGSSFRGIKRTKVIGFKLNLVPTNLFLLVLFQRQLAVFSFTVINSHAFQLTYRTQDDDILAQIIKLFNKFEYQVSLSLKAYTPLHVSTLMSSYLKFPI